MDDVRDLLREAVGSFEPRGDERSVEDRVDRRRRRQQVVAAVVALGILGAAGLLAWTALGPVGSTPGSTGWGTYTLSVFEVGSHVDRATGEADPLRADVTFTTRWSTGEYPGVRRCGLQVLDPAGSEIGTRSLELSSLARHGSQTVVVPVGGSIDGATAAGSCEPSRLDAPAAAVVSNAHLTRTVDGLSIVYDARAPAGIPDDRRLAAQACTAAVWADDDRLLARFPFASSAIPEGVLVVDGLDDEASSGQAMRATVTCVPYVREHVFPDPKPPVLGSSGSVTILVPDVVGLSPAEARARLEALGLTVFVTLGPTDEIAEGLVAAQAPLPGVEVTAGTSVTIEVSEGSSRAVET